MNLIKTFVIFHFYCVSQQLKEMDNMTIQLDRVAAGIVLVKYYIYKVF